MSARHQALYHPFSRELQGVVPIVPPRLIVNNNNAMIVVEKVDEGKVAIPPNIRGTVAMVVHEEARLFLHNNNAAMTRIPPLPHRKHCEH